MDGQLLRQFDALIGRQGYDNRSEAVLDLVRNALVEDRWGLQRGGGGRHDHHTWDLSEKLTEHQHAHHDAVISTLQVHLDAHFCLKVIVVKGTAGEVKHIADELIGTRGVVHGKLACTVTGQQLS